MFAVSNKTKRMPQEAVTGTYTAVPHALLDSAAFQGASHRARSLLFELIRQHAGKNNGHFHLAISWLKKRGWLSADQIQKAKVELLERNLIIKTRLGGLGAGGDLYAVTWLPISNFVGLDIQDKNYHPGAWRFMDESLPQKKRIARSVVRNGTVPQDGTDEVRTIPQHGTKTAVFDASAVPQYGNNECYQLSPAGGALRVVGVKGRSGRRKVGAQLEPRNENNTADTVKEI